MSSTRALLVSSVLLWAFLSSGSARAAELPTPGAAASCEAAGTLEVEGVGTGSEDLARTAQLAGLTPLRPGLLRRNAGLQTFVLCSPGSPAGSVRGADSVARPASVAPLPLSSRSFFNSRYPNDRNNGALWAGRGLSTELSGGVLARWRFLSAGLVPTVAFQQNRAFPIPEGMDAAYSPSNMGGNYWIDLPLRFGEQAFWTLDPGQSFVRLDAFNVALGFSTENLWWGPGVRNSIILSNTAGGFPHVFLGTSRPADVWAGLLEAQLVWGRLKESPYFDALPTNDDRLLVAMALTFEPRFARGLFLGAARVYNYKIPANGLPLSTYVAPMFDSFLKEDFASADNPYGQSPDNQLLSLFARWVLPESRAEFYVEWARDDHNWDLLDFAMEPEHSQAYLVGFQKVAAVGPRWLRLNAELSQLSARPVSGFWRPPPSFYTHYSVRQGYTHRGQMLGSAVGPGGASQYLAGELIDGSERYGLFLERTLRNELYYYERLKGAAGKDLELTAGLRHARSWRQLDAGLELALSHRWNRDFGPNEYNWGGSFTLTWWPGRTEAPVLPAPTRLPAGPALTPG